MRRVARVARAAVALWGGAFACAALAQDAPQRLSTAHDGRWNVNLLCDDTQGRNGLVKGYVFTFPVVIREGRLQGQHGSPGSASSVRFTGEVREDGTLEIAAAGNTGKGEYAYGAQEGTAYAYTMTGRLDAKSGTAKRRELRACTASFARLKD